MIGGTVHNHSRKYYGALAIALGLLSLGAGWYARIVYSGAGSVGLEEVRENKNNYKYINPLLLADSSRPDPEYNPLINAVKVYLTTAQNQKKINSASVYFRDLNSGHWNGWNENELYGPSSMLKVAVMIGYLKEAEFNPTTLNQTLYYTAQINPAGQYYPPTNPLSDGLYTIKDLIRAMITDSDNAALVLLYDNNRQAFVNVLQELAIPPPVSTTTLDFMSPRDYSSIFRTLYSSTYLPRAVSEQALGLLTGTTFKKGLVAGVPAEVTVAHKFGEHTDVAADGQVISRQLHDCGIIYYPTRPYFLCVMTRGADFANLETVIADVSRIVYDKVKDQKN